MVSDLVLHCFARKHYGRLIGPPEMCRGFGRGGTLNLLINLFNKFLTTFIQPYCQFQ